MYHSITFVDIQTGTEYNTWDAWHIIPSSRPFVAPPAQTTKILTIPGRSGTIDLTHLLSDEPIYSDRAGSWSFIAHPDYCEQWYILYSNIMNILNGKTWHVYLQDDPEWIYSGRVYVSNWSSQAQYSSVTVDYSVAPYKTSNGSSIGDWLWDPFNFQTGIGRCYSNLNITNNDQIDIIGWKTVGNIQITSNKNCTITLGNSSIDVTAGTNNYSISVYPEPYERKIYSKNDYVVYQSKFYQCVTDISNPQVFVQQHWTEVQGMKWIFSNIDGEAIVTINFEGRSL